MKCHDNMTVDELKDWWFLHSKKFKQLPGLKWYTINFPIDCSPFGSPVIDGFEELWFESLDDLKKAYRSSIMQNELENMRKRNLCNPELFRAVWLEENIIPLKGYDKIPDKKGMIRLTGICIQPPTMTKKDLKDWFYQHAANVIDKNGYVIIPGIKWYTHCFALDDSPFGSPKFNGVAENWWLSLEEIKKDFKSDVMKSQLKDREENIDIVDKSFFEGFWSEEFVIDISEK